jgi:probable phosphoglycerate mutase
MTIVIVRHGETDGNAARVLQRPDVPLNKRGLRQAELVAQRLTALGFVHILCSNLVRAQMTAGPLVARSGVAVEESPLLQERNFGDLRGTAYAALGEDPFGPDFAPPNGEDWPTFHARVAEAFTFIVSRRRDAGDTMVVITHGLVCRALVERHAQVSAGAIIPDRFDNTGVTILHEEAPHRAGLINCTRHLSSALEANLTGGGA